MAQYFASIQTAQVTTGNFRTTVDVRDTNKPHNNAANPLGAAYYDNAVTVANPEGVPTKYRYVRYLSTANAAVIAAPGPVFWADNTFTTVTSTMSEALTTKAGSVAGYLMPNTTDLTTLTAANLNGNFVWIAVSGYVKAAASAAATAVDDWLIGGATAWVPVLVVTGTSPGVMPLATALTAVASSKSDVLVRVESM